MWDFTGIFDQQNGGGFLNEIIQGLSQLNIFISSTEIHKEKNLKKQWNLFKLKDMKEMKDEIISAQKEKKKVRKDLDDLKDSNRQINNEDREISSCFCGNNVKLKLKNVETKILPGFILCDAQHKPCEVGRIFDAQNLVEIIEHKSTISSGYSAYLHIHAAVAEIQLIALIDRKTSAIIEEHPRFIKQDQTAIARFELSTAEQCLCMEIFECYPQLGTFTLHDGERTVALGKVLKIIE